jgi:hypothetical protein
MTATQPLERKGGLGDIGGDLRHQYPPTLLVLFNVKQMEVKDANCRWPV